MEPTFAAAFNLARQLFDEFTETVRSLPAEALDWRPAPGASSVAQLAAHVASSTPFWFAAAVGERRDIIGYRRGERERAFETVGASADELSGMLRAAVRELERLAALGQPHHLGRVIEWEDDDGSAPKLTGAEALFRAVSHVREHLGHAQLTRDVWKVSRGRP